MVNCNFLLSCFFSQWILQCLILCNRLRASLFSYKDNCILGGDCFVGVAFKYSPHARSIELSIWRSFARSLEIKRRSTLWTRRSGEPRKRETRAGCTTRTCWKMISSSAPIRAVLDHIDVNTRYVRRNESWVLMSAFESAHSLRRRDDDIGCKRRLSGLETLRTSAMGEGEGEEKEGGERERARDAFPRWWWGKRISFRLDSRTQHSSVLTSLENRCWNSAVVKFFV